MENTERKALILSAMQGRKLHVIGHDISLKLSSQETGGNCYVFEAMSPPGFGVPPHVHQHEDEIGYIIEGEYEIYLDGMVSIVTAGATLNFSRHISHGFRNVGKQSGRVLFFVTPGVNFEKFFNELSSLPANIPPDLEKVAEIFKRYNIELIDSPDS